MSQLTDNKLTVVGGGGGGGPEKPNVTAGRILRVRRPQPQEDGSLVAAEIVEEVREDDAIIVDEALLQASSVRTERLLPPSHRNSEAPSIAVPMATTPTRETRDFNILDGGYGWVSLEQKFDFFVGLSCFIVRRMILFIWKILPSVKKIILKKISFFPKKSF